MAPHKDCDVGAAELLTSTCAGAARLLSGLKCAIVLHRAEASPGLWPFMATRGFSIVQQYSSLSIFVFGARNLHSRRPSRPTIR
jgi:hypothetical protein